MTSFLAMDPYTEIRLTAKRIKLLDKFNEKLILTKGKLPAYGIKFEEFYSWLACNNMGLDESVINSVAKHKLIKTGQLIQTMRRGAVVTEISPGVLASVTDTTYLPKPSPVGRATINPHEPLKEKEYNSRKIESVLKTIEKDDTDSDFYYLHYLQYFLWSLNKVAYRLPKGIWQDANENLKDMPTDPFKNCPQWSTFIALDVDHDMYSPAKDNEREYVALGIWYGMINYGGQDFMLVTMVMRATHLGNRVTPIYWVLDLNQSSLLEALRATDKVSLDNIDQNFGIRFYSDLAPSADDRLLTFLDTMNAILFVNTEYREQVARKENMVKRLPRRDLSRQYILNPRPNIVEYEVYAEISKQLAAQEGKHNFTSRKAHIRKGHWHGYWTGPRGSDKRIYILKWVMPTFVRGTVVDDHSQ